MTRAKRRSVTKKLVASTALVGGALALAFGGAFAAFTDTVSAGPQTVGSGSIVIGTPNGGVNDLSTGATGIVPGDSIAREIQLSSSGSTSNLSAITLGFTASTSSLLDSDGTNGLQVSAKTCASAPTRTAGPPPTYTCSGGWTTVNIGGQPSTSVLALETTPAALTPLNSLTAGSTDYLVLTLTLPASAPGDLTKVSTACSGTKGGTSATENMESCTSALTYQFVATSRAGTSE